MRIKSHGVPLLLLSAAISEQVYAAATAVDDTATVATNGSVIINVLANDTLTATGQGGTLVSLGESQPFYGSAVVNADNTITYTPDSGYEGPDSFEYFVQDDDGGAYGDFAFVDITVSPLSRSDDEGPIESQVEGESNKETAAMLDDYCENPAEELASSCSALNNLALSNPDLLNDLMDQITPDEILMQRRMVSEIVRNQAGRLNSSKQLLAQGLGVGLLGGNTLLLNSYSGGAASSEGLPNWAVFGSIKFGETEREDSGRESGYDADTNGMMIGVNYRLRSDIDVGAAVDFTDYEVTFNSNSGDLESTTYSLNGYISWAMQEKITVDGVLGYSFGDISTRRLVTDFSNPSLPEEDSVKGDTDSSQYFVSGQVQYNYNRGALTAMPFARVEYIYSEVDSYRETGGDNPWLMNVGTQELDQFNLTLGIDTTYALSFDWRVMVPGLKVSVVSEENKDFAPISFSLVADDSNSGFELLPDEQDSLYYQVEVNSVFVMKGGLSAYGSFQFVEDYDFIDAYMVQLGFNYEL